MNYTKIYNFQKTNIILKRGGKVIDYFNFTTFLNSSL